MTCPGCQISYDPNHWDACPHCGCENELPREFQVAGVMRTSTILIASGEGGPEFYGSVEDVPESLRRVLVASTNGPDSGTIYIADQEGRARIHRAISNLPAGSPAPALTRFSGASLPQPKPSPRRAVPLATLWFVLVMVCFSGAVIWLVGSRGW